MKILSFADFKKHCELFFNMYFGIKDYDYFFVKNYYCGEGSFTFDIYPRKTSDTLYTICQNDFYKGENISVYDSNDNKKVFNSLTGAFNHIISEL